MTVDVVSRFLAVLAVVAGPGGLLLLAFRRHPALAALRDHALAAAAAVAGTAMVGSLWFSEVAGFVPCELCWWQRLAMYPLALLLTLAAVRRDDAVRPYARLLAGAGLLVSLWHVGIQRFPAIAGTSTCSADAPCTVMWVDVGGVLTIPTMAACGFVGVLALLALPRGVRGEAPDDDQPTLARAAGTGATSPGRRGNQTDHRTDRLTTATTDRTDA